MGWLEVLALLKRLLPLLSRVAPMLEAFVVSRATNGKDAEAAVQRVTAELKSELEGEFAAAAESRALLTRTLADHSERLRLMGDEVERLRVASGEHDARMEAVEMQIARLVRSLKTYAVVVMVLLILCTTLLVAMFLRR